MLKGIYDDMYYVKLKVILTIDDGPTEATGILLKQLSRCEVGAIMFFRGDLMIERKDIVLRAIEKGFIVGNHTMTHPSLFRRSISTAIDEIAGCDVILREMHKEMNRPYFPIFRFPYGQWNKMLQNRYKGYIRYFKSLGYYCLLHESPHIKWDINLHDGIEIPSKQERQRKIIKHIKASNGYQILVAHDIPLHINDGYFLDIIARVNELNGSFCSNADIRSLLTH